MSVLIQATLIAFLLCFALLICIKIGMGRFGFMLSVAFYALDPIIGMFAFCTTKDVFCAALLVTYCVGLSYLFGERRVDKRHKLYWFAYFTILLFLVGILRSNALVAAIVFVPILLFIVKKADRKWLLLSSVAGIVLCAVWLGPFSSMLHVEESPIGKWNMLCIAEQQIARCAFSDEVDLADKAQIEQIIPNIKYQENLSDIARDSFMVSSATEKEIADLYFYLGIKYPAIYLKAFIFHTEDMWSPFSVIDCYHAASLGESDVFAFTVQDPGTFESKIPALASILQWVSTDANFQRSPLGVIASIPFCVFLLVFLLVSSIVMRDKQALLFVVPLAIMTLSNVFGPCMLIRYFLYLFYATPIFIYLIGSGGARLARRSDGQY